MPTNGINILSTLLCFFVCDRLNRTVCVYNLCRVYDLWSRQFRWRRQLLTERRLPFSYVVILNRIFGIMIIECIYIFTHTCIFFFILDEQTFFPTKQSHLQCNTFLFIQYQVSNIPYCCTCRHMVQREVMITILFI